MKQFVCSLQLALLLVYVAVIKDRHVTAVSTPDLQQTINVLQAQVASLIEHREQNVQLSEQLKELREEVVILREKCRGTKNTATRLKWLESSVSEARGQISELGAALDRTTTLVTSLKSQVSANSLGLAFTKSGAQRLEEERHYKQALYENEVMESSDKKTRHQRYLRKRIDNLETRMILLEQEGRTVGTKLTDINEKLGLLEGTNSTSVDKVHASMLELLESVEALETKVDTNLPTVQKEISRTELNLGQLMQQTAVMKEEQENQKLSVKALGEGLSAIQQKISTNNGNAATSFYNLTYGHNQEKERCNANDVVNQLKSVIHQYDRIITSLPTACPNNGQSDKIEMLNLAGKPRLAACDKGWTLVQRRKDGTVQFNKDWEDYAVGFGTPQGEFWLGNEALHSLTNGNNSRLRVDMIDIYGRLWIAEYGNFRVGDRSSGFKLEVSGYSGNASDALDYQNGMQFSARDSDRDISNTHCAANYEGGWWFSHCQHANLNGRYNLGLTWFHAAKNEWIAVAESTMKLWTH